MPEGGRAQRLRGSDTILRFGLQMHISFAKPGT